MPARYPPAQTVSRRTNCGRRRTSWLTAAAAGLQREMAERSCGWARGAVGDHGQRRLWLTGCGCCRSWRRLSADPSRWCPAAVRRGWAARTPPTSWCARLSTGLGERDRPETTGRSPQRHVSDDNIAATATAARVIRTRSPTSSAPQPPRRPARRFQSGAPSARAARRHARESVEDPPRSRPGSSPTGLGRSSPTPQTGPGPDRPASRANPPSPGISLELGGCPSRFSRGNPPTRRATSRLGGRSTARADDACWK